MDDLIKKLKKEFLGNIGKTPSALTPQDVKKIRDFALRKCREDKQIEKHFSREPYEAPAYDNLMDDLMDEFNLSHPNK